MGIVSPRSTSEPPGPRREGGTEYAKGGGRKILAGVCVALVLVAVITLVGDFGFGISAVALLGGLVCAAMMGSMGWMMVRPWIRRRGNHLHLDRGRRG